MKKTLLFLIIGMFFLFLANVQFAKAANGDVVITYDDELNGGLTGATVTIYCDGTPASCLDGDADCDNDEVGGTITLYSASSTLETAGCGTDIEAINTLEVAKDGYVTTTDIDDAVYHTGEQNDEDVVLNFGFKVTDVANEISGDMTGGTVTTGNSYGTTCTEGAAGVYYCAVPLADTSLTIKYEEDGYVTNTGNSFTADRTNATDAQQTKAVTGVEYAVKITVLSGATVTTGDSYDTTCSEGSNYYCAVPLADTETNVRVVKTGYDTKTELNAWTDRTLNTDAQATCSLSLVAVAETIPRPPGRRRIIKKEPITIEGLKTKIAEISAKISQLRTQLQQLSGGEILEVPLEIPADYRFTVNLEYGQKGDDVRYLQVFLKAQGLEIYPEGLVTGYFGPLTQAAVIRFQEKHRDDILTPWEITEGTGFVGKTTRVKLNELLGR